MRTTAVGRVAEIKIPLDQSGQTADDELLKDNILVFLRRAGESEFGSLCRALFPKRISFQDGERLNRIVGSLIKEGLAEKIKNIIKITDKGRDEKPKEKQPVKATTNGETNHSSMPSQAAIIEEAAIRTDSANLLPEDCNDFLAALYEVHPEKKSFEEIADAILSKIYRFPKKEIPDFYFRIWDIIKQLKSANLINEKEDTKSEKVYYSLTNNGKSYIRCWIKSVDKTTMPDSYWASERTTKAQSIKTLSI